MTEQEWLTTEDPMDICRLISIQQIPGSATHQIVTAQGMAEVPRVEVSDRQIVLWLAACIDLSKHDYSGTYYKEMHRRPWRIGNNGQGDHLHNLRLWCRKEEDKPGDPSLPLRAHLLRDVIGNPWQRVPPLDPQWLTPQVLSLALAAWDDRPDDRPLLDTFRILLLADALEEAGCMEEQFISHLRNPEPHIRGCWALDRILGKE